MMAISGLQAQPKEEELVDRYGAIRADMVKEVCSYVGIKDKKVLQSINNESLKPFLSSVRNDTVKKIVRKARPLSGEDIDKYDREAHTTLKNMRDGLIQYYPDKKEEISRLFNPYEVKISLTTSRLRGRDTIKPSKEGEKTKAKGDGERPSGKGSSMPFVVLLLASFGLWILWKRRERNKTSSLAPAPSIREEHPQNEQVRLIDSDQTSSRPHETESPGSEEQSGMSSHSRDEQGEEKNPSLRDEADEGASPIGKKPAPDSGCCSAESHDGWVMVGASVQGNGHIQMEVPCQDSHAYEYLSDGWGIAITSDGAGSAKLSHKGSAAAVSRAMVRFKNLIEQKGWMKDGKLPGEGEWMKLSFQTLRSVHHDLSNLAQRMGCIEKDLSATIIVVIHSPFGLLCAHVGDGRAGYRDMEGNWHALITPHKGEEANQTIFLSSAFWNIPFYEMSGVTVPESVVIPFPITAFTLMSDGCESTSWLCNQYDESRGKYYDPNIPFAKFFDSLTSNLEAFAINQVPMKEQSLKWYHFVKEGNKSFVKETDDKTLILVIKSLPSK